MSRNELLSKVRGLLSYGVISAFCALVIIGIALYVLLTQVAVLLPGFVAAVVLWHIVPQLKRDWSDLFVAWQISGWLPDVHKISAKHQRALAVMAALVAAVFVASCFPAAPSTAGNQGQPVLVNALPVLNAPPAVCDSHVMRPGDNLYRVGLAHGIEAQTLAQINGIADVRAIRVGTVISIPCAE